MAFKLSKRLIAIAEMVDPSAYIADIGADHGYLPIHLVSNNRIQWAQAVENKMGPYLNLKQNVDRAGLASHITVTLGDGISSLNGGVDTLVIAGMGGEAIMNILSAHPENLSNIDTIIVDPHRDIKKVRVFMVNLGFHIQKEKMIKEDGIYYVIIKFKKGAPSRPYNLDEYRLGPKLLESPDEVFYSYLLEQKKRVNKVLNGVQTKEKREMSLDIYRCIARGIARCEAVQKEDK